MPVEVDDLTDDNIKYVTLKTLQRMRIFTRDHAMGAMREVGKSFGLDDEAANYVAVDHLGHNGLLTIYGDGSGERHYILNGDADRYLRVNEAGKSEIYRQWAANQRVQGASPAYQGAYSLTINPIPQANRLNSNSSALSHSARGYRP